MKSFCFKLFIYLLAPLLIIRFAYAQSPLTYCQNSCTERFNKIIAAVCLPLSDPSEVAKCISDVRQWQKECRESCYRLSAARLSSAIANFGGRVSYVSQCMIEDPTFEPGVCHTCQRCTGLLAAGCADVTEVWFLPAGGSKWNFICPQKTFLYKGGYPRPGGWLLGNGYSQFLFSQIGASR